MSSILLYRLLTRDRAGHRRLRGGRISHAMTSQAFAAQRPSPSSPADQRQLTALQRDLDRYLRCYGTDRAHTGRLTSGRAPAGIAPCAGKMVTVR
jgi:hypothetical protein